MEPFEFTVPNNTPITAPVTQIFHPIATRYTIRLYIPPGHKGLTGFRIQSHGRLVVPFGNSGTWIRGDGEFFGPYPFNNDAPDHAIEAIGYNTDIVYDHTLMIYIE